MIISRTGLNSVLFGGRSPIRAVLQGTGSGGGSGGGSTGSFSNRPAGLTTVATWSNESAMNAGGFNVNGSTPIGVMTQANMQNAFITYTTNSIIASTGSWSTAGLVVGQYVRATGTSLNDGLVGVVTAISASGTQSIIYVSGSPFTTDSTPDGAWSIERGWGWKERVTSGYSGTPSIGGPAVIRTFYPGGVEGGHDGGRNECTLSGTPSEVFFGIMVQYATDYPTSTSSGGNKQFFITTTGAVNGINRFFVNFDAGAAANRWGLYIQSSPVVDSSITLVKNTWIKVELYVRKPTVADNDGILRLWIDGTLAIELTNLSVAGNTFPGGNFVLVYDDGSNNGNHYPLGTDPRKIGTDLGGPLNASRWVSAMEVATA